MNTIPLPSLRWRIGFGLCLVLAMGTAPVVQYGLSVLAPFIIADLGLSRTQLGTLTSAMYIVSAPAAPLLGRWVDVLGGRTVLLGLFASGGTALLLASAGGSYPWLVAGSALAGLAMASANPVTNQLVGTLIPPGNRGLIMGIKQSGVMVGQTLAALAAPSLALLLGWRTALRAGTVVALAGVVMALTLLPRAAGPVRRAVRNGRRASLPGFVPRLALYGFFMGNGQATVLTYIALYAVERLAFSPTRAGLLAAVTAIVGVVSRIASGRYVERLETMRGPLVVVAAGGACAVVLLAVAPAAGAWSAWTSAVVFSATAQVWNVIGMLGLLRRVPPASMGRASGIVMMGFFTGFIAGPVVFGALVDATSVYTYSWSGVLATYIAAVALAAGSRELAAPLSGR